MEHEEFDMNLQMLVKNPQEHSRTLKHLVRNPQDPPIIRNSLRIPIGIDICPRWGYFSPKCPEYSIIAFLQKSFGRS